MLKPKANPNRARSTPQNNKGKRDHARLFAPFPDGQIGYRLVARLGLSAIRTKSYKNVRTETGLFGVICRRH